MSTEYEVDRQKSWRSAMYFVPCRLASGKFCIREALRYMVESHDFYRPTSSSVRATKSENRRLDSPDQHFILPRAWSTATVKARQGKAITCSRPRSEKMELPVALRNAWRAQKDRKKWLAALSIDLSASHPLILMFAG